MQSRHLILPQAVQVWTCISHSEFISANDSNTVTPLLWLPTLLEKYYLLSVHAVKSLATDSCVKGGSLFVSHLEGTKIPCTTVVFVRAP